MTSNKKVIVIGAGVGGTAIAARLAKDGFNVTVLEKNSFGGGRCSILRNGEHRFDQGPSLYLLPKLFQEFFEDLGENINDHIDLLKCPSNYKVHFHDGKYIHLTSDLPKLITEIERFEGKGEQTSQNLLNFIQESYTHYNLGIEFGLKNGYSNIFDVIKKFEQLPALFKVHILETVFGRICKYFSSDYIRRAFTFQTMYMGNSPFEAPAVYSLLQCTEIIDGIWYPKGGFYEVVKALENIAIKHGAKFKYDAPVLKINVDVDYKVTGVTLEDETVLNADLIVCNADTVYAYNRLLPWTEYGMKLGNKFELTASTISFYWSLSKQVLELDTHNIFLAKAYKESFDEIFKEFRLPSEPSFYIHVPNRIDETAAPVNKDTLVVLVPVGHVNNLVSQNFDEWIKRARNAVITTIEERCKVTNFEQLIEHEMINDPRSWKEKFNLWKGSALGLSHIITQMLCFRPSTRCKIFKNLYFVGASTQPGTGVPVVLCSAKLAANQINEDQHCKTNKPL
ncbi:phytoene desaturase-like protein, partial [Leptotrombidium deliense]